MSREKLALTLGLLAFCTGVIVCLYALVLGVHFEATDRAMRDSAKGHLIAVPAVIALLAGVVGLTGRRRSWAFGVLGVGVVAALVAIVLAIVLPSG